MEKEIKTMTEAELAYKEENDETFLTRQTAAYKEAIMLTRVPHPNIVRVRDCFKQGNQVGTVLEYLDTSSNLLSLIKESTQSDTLMTERDCMNFFVQIILAFK